MQPTRLAYLGPEGTYTHQAALGIPADVRVACRSITAVFETLERGEAQLGVVPGENVLEGGVGETLDALLDSHLAVSGEIVLPIEHCLIGRAGGQTKRVYSHPQALAQCSSWLNERLPDAERVECCSTGDAASLAARDPEAAAIGPGARAGLTVIARGLAEPTNRTRFFVIARELAPPTGGDRSLIAFGAPHRPGALHACLAPFAERRINLTRIESRPVRDAAWTYRFAVEIEGHPREDAVAETLMELGRIAREVRVLGAWPAVMR